MCKICLFSEQVQGSAKRANDGRRFPRCPSYSIADHDGIVLADNLPEIAGGSQVMMKATVRDKEDVSARNFPINYPAHIHAGFTDKKAAKLEDDLRLWETLIQAP